MDLILRFIPDKGSQTPQILKTSFTYGPLSIRPSHTWPRIVFLPADLCYCLMVFRATSRRTDKGEFLAGSHSPRSLGVIDMNFDSGQTHIPGIFMPNCGAPSPTSVENCQIKCNEDRMYGLNKPNTVYKSSFQFQPKKVGIK